MTLNEMKVAVGTTREEFFNHHLTINEYYTGCIAVFTYVTYPNHKEPKTEKEAKKLAEKIAKETGKLHVLLADPRNHRFGEVINGEAKRYFCNRIYGGMKIHTYHSPREAVAALNSYRSLAA